MDSKTGLVFLKCKRLVTAFKVSHQIRSYQGIDSLKLIYLLCLQLVLQVEGWNSHFANLKLGQSIDNNLHLPNVRNGDKL